MHIRESVLPAIGKKFRLETREGDLFVLIVHDDGRREWYQFDRNRPDEVVSTLTLDDDEARLVAGILGGMVYKPKALETIEIALDELVIEWYSVENSSRCVGRTIGELHFRRHSGATIIAVVERDHTKQINPGPDYPIRAGATLVVAGERRQHKTFRELLAIGCDAE
ncbi:MAG: cation:proton antiporter regulatory subunit [Paenibacillaceae bacterium]|nr:cation:proton antiporter regulatory subunit [Paenibacillaceae bacterium]